MEFWFDFASTYSYPAALSVGAAAAAAQVPLVWKPFLLGPVFRRYGINDSPFNLHPVKGKYMWRDLERLCAARNLPWRRPGEFPRNSLLAARIACHCAAEPWLPAFIAAVYRANFAEDRDIAEPALLTALLDAQGLPGADILRAAGDDANKERLRLQPQEAFDLGIFGAPTCVVDGELFWGSDRLEAALAWAQRRAQ
jgi:2-hydroxychromene-2-carboxylate isomerase